MLPSWASLIKAMAVAVVFITSVYTILLVGPEIEGRFFPVLDRIHIIDAESVDDGMIEVRVWTNKIRACEYVGLSWYRGLPNHTFSRARLVLQPDNVDAPASPTRPLGVQRMGPWHIEMTIHDLYNNSFADITHRCHILWPTVTRVHP